MSRNYEKLKAFEYADALVLEVYRLTDSFPKSEMFGLVSQLRSAAVSVPAAIVQGSTRHSDNEFIAYLKDARGALAELGYYIKLSFKLEYVSREAFDAVSEKQDICMRTLHGLIKSFDAKKTFD